MKFTSAVSVLAVGAFAGKVEFDFAQSKPLYDAAKSQVTGLTSGQMRAIPSMVRAGALKALGVKPQQRRMLIAGDCDKCNTDFTSKNGCEIMTSGQDWSSVVDAQECGLCMLGFLEVCSTVSSQDCAECIATYKRSPGCGALATGAQPSAECTRCSLEIATSCAADAIGNAADCVKCAMDFKIAGGCELMNAGQDPSSKVPAGCDACGAEGAAICQEIPIIDGNGPVGLDCIACGFEALSDPASVCASGASAPQGCDAKCHENWCQIYQTIDDNTSGWPSADEIAKITDTPCKDAFVALGDFMAANDGKCMPGDDGMQEWCTTCSTDMKPLTTAVLAACTTEKLAPLGEFGEGFLCNADMIDVMCLTENGVNCMQAFEGLSSMEDGDSAPNATMLDKTCPCIAKLGEAIPKMMECSGESEEAVAGFAVMKNMMCEKTNGNYCFPVTMEMFAGMETLFNPAAEKGPKKTVDQLDHMCTCTKDMDQKLKDLMQVIGGDDKASGESEAAMVDKLLDAMMPMMRLECIKDDENNYCALQENFDSTIATVQGGMGGMFGGSGEGGSGEAPVVWSELCSPCFKRVLVPVMDAGVAMISLMADAFSGMGTDPTAVLTPEQQAQADEAAKQAKQMMDLAMEVSKRTFSASCLKQEDGKTFCGEVAGKLQENSAALLAPLMMCNWDKADTCVEQCSKGLEAVNTAVGSCAGPLLEIQVLGLRMMTIATAGETGITGNVTTGVESPLDIAKVMSEVEGLRKYAADVCKVPIFVKFGDTKNFDFTLTNLKDTFVEENMDDLIEEIKNDAAGSLGIAIDSIKDVVLVTGSDGTVKVTVTIEAADPDDQKAIEASDGTGLGDIFVSVPDEGKVDPTVDVGAATPTPAPAPTPDAEKVSSAGRATATLAIAAAVVAAIM